MKRKGAVSLKATILMDLVRSLTNEEAAQLWDVLETKKRKFKQESLLRRKQEWTEKHKVAGQQLVEALRAEGWDWVQHVCLFGSGMNYAERYYDFHILIRCTACDSSCVRICSLRGYFDQTTRCVTQLSLAGARKTNFNETGCCAFEDNKTERELGAAEVKAILDVLDPIKPLLRDLWQL